MRKECREFRTKLCDMLLHVDKFDGEEFRRTCHLHLDTCITCRSWFDVLYAPQIAELNKQIKEERKK